MTNTTQLTYFAYGSNMSLNRLRQRVPSAKPVGTYRLDHHALKFHKKGRDGSAKCDAFHTDNPEDYVLGGLFEIKAEEKTSLDEAEKGYLEKIVTLYDSSGKSISAFSYFAYPSMIDPSLKPYTWYLDHVIIGALENQLPNDYVNNIRGTQACKDPNLTRDHEENAIHKNHQPSHSLSIRAVEQ